jgi:hypothetical protein
MQIASNVPSLRGRNVNLARDQKEEASCGPSTQVIFRVHFASMKLGPQRANLMGVKMSERTHTAPTAAQELTRLPSAVSISFGTTAHLLESCRSVDAIPTHLCPQSQTDRAGFDAVFDCSTEKSYIHVAAAGGLIVSNTTMQGKPRSMPTTARTFRYRFWNGLPENPT